MTNDEDKKQTDIQMPPKYIDLLAVVESYYNDLREYDRQLRSIKALSRSWPKRIKVGNLHNKVIGGIEVCKKLIWF